MQFDYFYGSQAEQFIEERIPFNVHFKKPFAPTYMEQFDR